MQASSRNWNAVIGTTPYEWIILPRVADRKIYFSIARADGKFIQGDDKANGKPLYCDKDTGAEFQLMAFTDEQNLVEVEDPDTDPYVLLKSPSGTYLSTVAPSSTNPSSPTPTNT